VPVAVGWTFCVLVVVHLPNAGSVSLLFALDDDLLAAVAVAVVVDEFA
jgi:hypothetical protein